VRARNISIGRCVRVHLFDNGFGNRRAPWCDWPVSINSRGASAPQSIGNDLYLVGNCILGPLLVGFCSWDFAIGRLVVHSFDTGDWNGRSTTRSIWGSSSGVAAFRGIREVLFAL